MIKLIVALNLIASLLFLFFLIRRGIKKNKGSLKVYLLKKLKKALKYILILIVTISIGGYFILQSYKPKYSGKLNLPNLKQEVKVYFDEYGIPHIYAQNKADLYYAFGYLHAQERLFQMEILRRIASGRLSEIIGAKLIKTDKLFRTIQINKKSEESVKKYFSDKNAPMVKDVDNYLKGVNEFLMNGKTPIEYQLLGIKKEKFNYTDLYNIAGFMAFSFAEGFKLDPMISKIKNELGNAYLEDLITSYVPNTERIKLTADSTINYSDLSKISLNIMDVIDNSGLPFFEGSNSWVLSGKKTENGKVLFANDTHMAYSQPGVWYEAHLECPKFNLYGNFIAGVPFSLLGHNRNLAWGLTMFENDDVDFFYEEIKPSDTTKYKSGEEWKSFEFVTETIKVKKQDDVTFIVRKTERGPIINDAFENIGNTPVSLFWTFTHTNNEIMQLFYGLNNANNIVDAKNSASKLAAPGLNIMYGDKFGNIAYWASAKITKYKDVANRSIIQTNDNYPIGFYDFKENPKTVNPDNGFVYTANNQPDSINGILYPGYYSPEDRAKTIVNILSADKKWNVEEIKKMHVNSKSFKKAETAKVILNELNENIINKSENHKKAYNILKHWDGDHQLNTKGAVIYYRLIRKILEFTMVDELGKDDFEFMSGGHTSARSIPELMKHKKSVWWDNISTEKKETRSDIFNLAFDSTIVALNKELGKNIEEWKWGKVHTVEYQHSISKGVKALSKVFNVGPFNVWGGHAVLNKISFRLTANGKYKAGSGPSMRTIIDFSDIEKKSYSIIPTGQSGIFMSKHYSDQAKMYNTGKYRKQMMNKEEIIENSEDVLILVPKEK